MRRRLIQALLFLGCAGASLLTRASAADAKTAEAEEIVVTGSRLHSVAETVYPTSTIGGLEIERRGITEVIDAVRSNPATGLGVQPAGTQASQGAGSAFVDLFDLGTQRTLTLVDGRRVVGGNQSTLFGQAPTGLQVDLNTVPTGLIERIDIVSVGGTPSYGADAIAGTVNIILRRDYTGAEVDSLFGAHDGGFGDTWRLRGLYGRNFDEDRGNITLTAERVSVDGFLYDRGSYLRNLPALAANPRNGRPFTSALDPNGVFNNILIQNYRIPSVTTGGAILRSGLIPPNYLTPAGRAYLLAHPDIAAAHPEFALGNGLISNGLITRPATAAEIAAGARAPDDVPGPPRIAVPLLFNPDGSVGAMDVGTIAADQPLNLATASGGDGLSLVPYQSLQSQLDRVLLSALTTYRFDSTLNIHADVHYAKVRGVEPANQPAYNGTIFGGISGPLGFRTDNPFLGDQARATLSDPRYNLDPATRGNLNAGSAFGGCLVPNMPAELAAACPTPAAGTRVFYISRALDDLTGTTPSRTTTETVNAVLEADGELPFLGDGWTYGTVVTYGHSYAVNRNVSILQAQFNAARDAVAAGDGIVCRVNASDAAEREAARFAFRYTSVAPTAGTAPLDPSSPAPVAGFYRRAVGDPLAATEASLDACAPLNLFGEGSPSDAARAYVAAPLITSNRNDQIVYDLTIAGPLAHLWAGDLEVAAGLSWRREGTSFQAENDISRYGLARAVAYGDLVDRSYTSLEYYAEAALPLVDAEAGVPLIHDLSLNASYRSIDNSIAGRDDAWTYGFSWSLFDGLTVRGGKTRSVRSPSLTELYLRPSGTFQPAQDPCDVRFIAAGPSPAIRKANCQAAAAELGEHFLDNFNALVALVPSQGQLDGNPELGNETADSQTIGIMGRTDAVFGEMSLAVDYIDIEVDDAIEALSFTRIMEACYDNPVFPNPFCSRFTRAANFQVAPGSATSPAFFTTYVNIGRRDYAGITGTATWTFDLGDVAQAMDLGSPVTDLGTLDLRLVYTHIAHLRTDIDGSGQAIEVLEGEIGRPINEHQLTATYLNGPFTLVWVWAHQGRATFDAQPAPENREQTGVESYDLFDASVLYDLTDDVQARLTVNNVFDSGPPFGSGSIAYDQVGRFWQAGLKVRF